MNARRFLLSAVLVALCATSSPARDDKKSAEPKPPSPEQITAWLKKFEEPTRHYLDPKQGPPEEGVGPDFDFRIHGEAIFLARAGEAARPGAFALLEDTKKSGQARAHAAIVLVEWLLGKGAKQEPNPKVLKALKEALKDKDQALKWGVLHWCQRYGKVSTLHLSSNYSDEEFKKKFGVERETLHFSDAAMDGLLPEIIALVADEEPVIASTAAYTICTFGRPKQGVKELIAALDRREPRIRASAVVALGRVGRDDPAALKAVLGQLKPEHYPGDYYTSVVIAVGDFGPKAKDAVPALIEVIKSSEFKPHKSMMLYDRAFLALGEIGPDAKSALPVMLKYLDVQCTPKFMDALDKIDRAAGDEGRAIMKRSIEKLRSQGKP
jgi:HEAT repeat protein